MRRKFRNKLTAVLSPFLNDKGIAAVEFALILPVLLWLLVGLFELAIMLHTMVVVEGATGVAGRMVRTGQTQSTDDPIVSFKTALCNELYSVIGCDKLTIDVRTAANFAGISFGLEFDDSGTAVNTQFSAGTASDIVVVTVAYNWTFFTPLVYVFLGDGGGPTKLIYSTAVFRNEPFE